MRSILKKFLFSAVLLYTFIYPAFAQTDFTFDFDYSLFKDESGKNIVEFYYSFNPDNLIFEQVNGEFQANGRLDLEVVNKTLGKAVVYKSFKVPVNLKDTSGTTKDFKLTGQINMLLDSGLYEFKINASDFSNPSSSFSAVEVVTLKDFPAGSVSMSTIQLGTKIVKSSDMENIFYKNTLEVTPNPSSLFGNNLSHLYYYLELYDLNSAQLGSKFKVTASVSDLNGNELKTVSKVYDLRTDSKVEYGSFDINGLTSNRYLFQVRLFDEKDQEQIKAFKHFYVFSSDTSGKSSDLTDAETEFLISDYAAMSEEKVDDEFAKAIYIMQDLQKKQYESLKTIDEKRFFMFRFWKALSKIIPKKEYFERLKYADKQFKSDFRDGWKTDRGRIYSLYGKYDEIDRFPYEGSTRAYEVWTYNKLQGGVTFVFIDMTAGFGDYVLVHSTAQNELRDDNWQDKLSIR